MQEELAAHQGAYDKVLRQCLLHRPGEDNNMSPAVEHHLVARIAGTLVQRSRGKVSVPQDGERRQLDASFREDSLSCNDLLTACELNFFTN